PPPRRAGRRFEPQATSTVTVHTRTSAGQAIPGEQSTPALAVSCASPFDDARYRPRVTPRAAALRVSTIGASTSRLEELRPLQGWNPCCWWSVTEICCPTWTEIV